MGALYRCFDLVMNHRHCISTTPELAGEIDTNNFESNPLANRLFNITHLSLICQQNTNITQHTGSLLGSAASFFKEIIHNSPSSLQFVHLDRKRIQKESQKLTSSEAIVRVYCFGE